MQTEFRPPTLYAHWGWWLLGFVLLLALCDDDDDDEYCYTFGSERICLEKPLPTDAHCYLMENREVQCFEKPLE